ncbi:DUF6427 family protein [Salibacter sp.]|uniref:DUF6427 family protein n=2 Tax=Salibacter sp. TaxID=2010995 RepID=UPI00287030C5|nr:DUF6427 family protein [Salibacter sp.]MDR9486751.1 DUF6427 family protein [Salibacter sp.]
MNSAISKSLLFFVVMTANFFKTSQPATFFLAPLIVVITRLAFFGDVHFDHNHWYSTPLFQKVFTWVLFAPWFEWLLATVIVIIQGFLFNAIINSRGLLERVSSSPLIAYMIMASFFAEQLFLSPALIANFFLLFAMKKVLEIPQQTNTRGKAFDAAFYVGIGSLFYAPAVCAIVMVIAGLAYFKSFVWRDHFVTLIGAATPWLFYYAIIYITGADWESPFKISDSVIHDISLFQGATVILAVELFLVLMIVLPSFFKSIRLNIVRVRKSYLLLLWWMILVLLSWYIFNVQTHQQLHLMVAPLAIMIANYFYYARIAWMRESLFYILIALALFNTWFVN